MDGEAAFKLRFLVIQALDPHFGFRIETLAFATPRKKSVDAFDDYR